jgi:xanthosine utilization system XapX-like protein
MSSTKYSRGGRRPLPWIAVVGLMAFALGRWGSRSSPNNGLSVLKASEPDPTPLITAYHGSARSELIERISRRDTALFLYLAATATVATVLIKDYPAGAMGFLVIPVIGLGVALIHSHHNIVIGALGVYLGHELQAAVERLTGMKSLPSWDDSQSLHTLHGHISARFGSGLIVIVVPQLLSLLLALRGATAAGRRLTGWEWAWHGIAVVAVLTSVAVIVNSQLLRRRFRRRMSSPRCLAPSPSYPGSDKSR